MHPTNISSVPKPNVFKRVCISTVVEVTLVQNFDTRQHQVYTQPINPKTGRGWQARKVLVTTSNGLEALAIFNRETRKLRGGRPC